jgi:hypothetical protein
MQGVWAVVGPLVGVWVGAYLTGRRQKQEWVADNKKEEYRELVKAITGCLSAYVQVYAVQTLRSGDDERRILGVDANFVEVVRSRLFIGREVRALDVEGRFIKIKQTFREKHIVELFINDTDALLDKISAAASADISSE